MKKKHLQLMSLFLSVILINGCTSKLILTDDLPDATLGEFYRGNITITGGSGFIAPASVHFVIKPEDSGMNLIPNFSKPLPYNELIIYGRPKTLDDIEIKVKGEAVSSQILLQNSTFDKTYIIKVKKGNK